MNTKNSTDAGSSATAMAGPLESNDGLKAALDNLETNVFVADEELRLIYANRKALKSLRGIESEIRTAFGVGIADIIGGSIHRFHRDPDRIEAILRDPRALPHNATFSFGTITLRTSINRIRTEDGSAVGYIVNWDDVTEEQRNQAERERADAGH